MNELYITFRKVFMSDKAITVFENFKIRRHFDEKTEIWYFSVIDILQVLIQQPDYHTARKYWNKLKERLKKEGSQSVTNCHQLKMESTDGKKYSKKNDGEPIFREFYRELCELN